MREACDLIHRHGGWAHVDGASACGARRVPQQGTSSRGSSSPTPGVATDTSGSTCPTTPASPCVRGPTSTQRRSPTPRPTWWVPWFSLRSADYTLESSRRPGVRGLGGAAAARPERAWQTSLISVAA
jgi:hypothetical protein